MEVTAVTILILAGTTTVQPVNVCNRPVLEFKTGLVTIIAIMKITMLLANGMVVTAVTILTVIGIGIANQIANVWIHLPRPKNK